MEKDVIIIPTLKTTIENIKDKKQIKLIYNGFKKIKELGLKAIKILYVRNEYILGEIKYKNPPYRLYDIINKTKNKFYLVDWQHKKNQQKAIGNLKSKFYPTNNFKTTLILVFLWNTNKEILYCAL